MDVDYCLHCDSLITGFDRAAGDLCGVCMGPLPRREEEQAHDPRAWQRGSATLGAEWLPQPPKLRD